MKRGELLWAAQLGLCYLCGQPMDHRPHNARQAPDGWTRDHLRPRSRGGRLSAGNVLLAHMACNSRRGDALPTREACAYAAEVARVERALRLLLETHPFDAFLRGALCALDMLHADKGVVGESEWPSHRLEAARRVRRTTKLRGMR